MSLLPYSLFAILSVAACTPVASHEAPTGGEDGGESATGEKPRITGGSLRPEEQVRAAPGLDEGSCDAEAAQRFVGQKADETNVKAAVTASGSKTVRVIKPDMMVTMDFRGDRLNIRVDGAGKIIAVTCG